MPFSVALIIGLMVAWGLYYELIGIGIFSYVSRYHSKAEQSKYFGIVYLFMNIAYVVGPLFGGYVVLFGSTALYGLCLVFIALACALLPKVVAVHKTWENPLIDYSLTHERYSFGKQWRSYKKVWKYASIFFIAAFLYNVWDSFVWTLVPIQGIGGNIILAGIITSTFTIPLALFEGYGGRIADKYGRNVTFVAGLFVAALFTLVYGLQTDDIPKVLAALVASLGFAFAYPALMGETSQDGQDHQSELGNMAGVQRIFVNAGFIVGPITAGFLANAYGIQRTFFILGCVMLLCCLFITIAMIRFHMKGRIHRAILAEFDM